MAIEHSTEKLTRADFVSDQMVKWCPGCGDHAILASLLNIFPQIGYKKENYCVVSGIGCSSRFPYYVDTYGFHGIHGRAAAIATGVKIANPGLSVWVASGDGDGTAIGGNHFIHMVRRNMDFNYILFNNEIYGLTKGQYSPTTKHGQVTVTSPHGVIDYPLNPGELVLGARGTFFARGVDNNPKGLQEVFSSMAEHDGTAVVEVLQNCIIYNDKTHQEITDRATRDEKQIWLEHGKPMLFGKEKEKGLMLRGTTLEVVEIGKDGITIDDILVHDKRTESTGIHQMLTQIRPPEFPMAFGVIRAVEKPTYNQMLRKQIEDAKAVSKITCVDDLLNSGDTWEIE